MMEVNEKGFELIKSFEGFSSIAYRCPSGAWTIGFGHTLVVAEGKTVNYLDAIVLLVNDIKGFSDAIRRLVRVDLSNNQFSALVSFVFNVGVGNFERSTLLRLLNDGDYNSVPCQLARWVNGTVSGKKVRLSGLVRRRKAEAELWAM